MTGSLPRSSLPDVAVPDPEQTKILEHDRGPLLVTGGPGTGKSTVLRERFARLIEAGADPERVALVVRSRAAAAPARRALLTRLARALPGMKVLTVHGLALHVVSERFDVLGYDRPPDVLSALDQLTRVRDLLTEEDPAEWPAYGGMLGLRGFADEVRQFLTRAQEALLRPEDVQARAEGRGLGGWRELAGLYRRYLDVLGDEGTVDFAGLVVQAAAAAREAASPFDHLVVDDYQEATVAEEALLAALAPASMVVAGDVGSHVFSFQGTTDAPLRRFLHAFPGSGHVELSTPHRGTPAVEAWFASHSSEEHAAVARELRRIHVEDGVPWGDLAVVVRRGLAAGVAGLVRALDDAGVPRAVPEGGPTLVTEPAVVPYELALRWVARPGERDLRTEAVLTSDLVGLSPGAARALVRAARAAGEPPSAALERADGLTVEEQETLAALRRALAAAEAVAERSVLDAFAVLWRDLPLSARLVRAAESSARGRRDADAALALADAVAAAAERADPSTSAFLDLLDTGQDEPGVAAAAAPDDADAVRVVTAHGAAGREFDTVVVVDAVEGNFPSLARPEPMFDLAVLEARVPQSARNRLRLEDERRLFDVVIGRARRRVLITASDPHADAAPLTVRSRFVAERGIGWNPAPTGADTGDPLSVEEAAGAWRRALARDGEPAGRLAALTGLLALGDRPPDWWYQRAWTGVPDPIHRGVRVSFSKLDTLENCGLQFVLSEELGLEGEAGYYAWVGHLVHRIIEDCENGLVDRTLDALVAAAEERWSEAVFPSRAVSEAFRRAVTTTMLPAWLREYGITPALGREVRFEFDYEGARVTGFIDRVSAVQTGGTQITDYKTGKSRSKSADDSLQLGIYFLAVNRAEELAAYRPVKAVELAFLKDLRDGRIVRVQQAMTTQEQAEFGARMAARLAALIGRIGELNATEVYRPDADAQCRFCDFKPLCPLWPEGRELQGVGR